MGTISMVETWLAVTVVGAFVFPTTMTEPEADGRCRVTVVVLVEKMFVMLPEAAAEEEAGRVAVTATTEVEVLVCRRVVVEEPAAAGLEGLAEAAALDAAGLEAAGPDAAGLEAGALEAPAATEEEAAGALTEAGAEGLEAGTEGLETGAEALADADETGRGTMVSVMGVTLVGEEVDAPAAAEEDRALEGKLAAAAELEDGVDTAAAEEVVETTAAAEVEVAAPAEDVRPGQLVTSVPQEMTVISSVAVKVEVTSAAAEVVVVFAKLKLLNSAAEAMAARAARTVRYCMVDFVLVSLFLFPEANEIKGLFV